MKHFTIISLFYLVNVFVGLHDDLLAQQRPDIFFREDFKEIPPEVPITQTHINDQNLLMSVYGPGADLIKKSHHDTPEDDPYYVWSGLCEGNWAITLKHKTAYVDLSGQAKIRWRSKQSGLRQLHLILKLSDGTWLISNASDPLSKDWRVKEFIIQDIRWLSLNIETIIEGALVNNPNLSRVDEIGWTDLMRGGGSEACSRVDWMEVDGIAVNKDGN